MNNTAFMVKGVGVLILSSYMLLTAISFFRIRLKKKDEKYRNLISILKIENKEGTHFIPSVRSEHSHSDYLLPVTFVTFICFLGSVHLLFGTELFNSSSGNDNLLLSGVYFGKSNIQIQRQSLIAMTFAFTGGFIWSAQNITRRLITADLTPGAYYSSGLRMIYAAFTALMLSFLFETANEEYLKKILPVVAFMTGMFPDQAFHYLREKVRVFSERKNEKSHDLQLDMIEGMNMYHKSRFSEFGIDNAQNLAEANLLELILKTSFSASQLIDWISQAKLYVYFKTDIDKLRNIGIRTIFDLISFCDSEEQLNQVAQKAEIPEITLKIVYHQAKDDKIIKKLFEYHSLLS